MKADLNDRFLKSLRAPETGRIEVSDAKRKGLRFRLTPSAAAKGTGVWMFEMRIRGGGKRNQKIGTWPAVSIKEARQIALELEAEASQGVDRVAEAEERKRAEEATRATRSTVRDVLDAYDRLHLSQLRTGAERRRQLEHAFAGKLDLAINELGQKDFQKPIDDKLTGGRVVYANRIRAALVAFSKWAWMRGYLEENVGQRIGKPTKERARDRVLSIEEVRAIYEAAGELGYLWGPLVRLLLLTGQRRGEIVSLRWEEVDLDAARIVKPGSTTKNRKPHTTHLSVPALEILHGLGPKKQGFVFTTNDKTPVSGISRMKRRLDALLGEDFEPWRFHDFRTAMATALADAGVAETVVDRIQNHVASGSAPSAVARVYNQSEQLPQRARALDSWAMMIIESGPKLVRIYP